MAPSQAHLALRRPAPRCALAYAWALAFTLPTVRVANTHAWTAPDATSSESIAMDASALASEIPHSIAVLRGGCEGERDSTVTQCAAGKFWSSISASRKRHFASLAQALDEWLLREKGVSLRHAKRPIILEALQAHQHTSFSPSKEAPLRVTKADDEEERQDAHTNGAALTVQELNERLWLACQIGDADVVRSAIEQGAHVNCADENGWTALHFAANANQISVIQLLLMEKGADPELADATGVTALMLAASHGYTLAVEQLLVVGESQNVNAHETVLGLTAMHLAAANNHVHTFRPLYLHGADLLAEDFSGRTPEMCARLQGYSSTAERLAMMAVGDAETEASFRELQRASLTAEEAAIARAAGFSVGVSAPPCELRSRRAGGLALAKRLNPSKYDLRRPGFPPLDGTLANQPRFDPFTCLPNDTVRKGPFEFIPDPPEGARPPGELWSFHMSPEDEAHARDFVERFVEFVD